MPRVPRHFEAFGVLNAEATPWGRDRIVRAPVSLLERRLNVGYQAATRFLRDLERRGAIAVEKGPRDMKSISSVRILRKEFSLQTNEKGNADRLLEALNEFSTRVQGNHRRIVYSGSFPKVQGKADIPQSGFYPLLNGFEEKGLVEIVRDQNSIGEKILSVELTESFPKV